MNKYEKALDEMKWSDDEWNIIQFMTKMNLYAVLKTI